MIGPVFIQPMVCEGQIESWLTALLQSIKSALQYQVATATGLEKRRPTRVIYSAGARRVSLTEKKISGRLNKGKIDISIGHHEIWPCTCTSVKMY